MRQILNSQEIEDALRKYIRAQGWGLLDCRISGFESFQEIYGPVAGNEVLRFAANLIGEVIDEIGTPDDQLGNPEINDFVIITAETAMSKMRERLKSRFNAEVLRYYSLGDLERGYLIVKDHDGNERHESLMRLAVGGVTADKRGLNIT